MLKRDKIGAASGISNDTAKEKRINVFTRKEGTIKVAFNRFRRLEVKKKYNGCFERQRTPLKKNVMF